MTLPLEGAASGDRRAFRHVRRDLQRYFELESRTGSPSTLEKLGIIAKSPGLHAVLAFRLASWANRNARTLPLRALSRIACFFLDKFSSIVWGIHVDKEARIDGGLYVGHARGILVGPIKMGKDCNIGHGVTIGRRAGGDLKVPTIGDRVWIGTGCVVFGGIHIGDGSTLGPLTVVGRSVPSRVLVMGNPMRLLQRSYDNRREIYGCRDVSAATAPSSPEVPLELRRGD